MPGGPASSASNRRRAGGDIASANWHATAALVARLTGEALFVDMGSTTTDIIPVRNGAVASEGYTDAERLMTGELVYTGFTRTFLFGVASSAPVRGRLTPLMNEYFASIADVAPHHGRARREGTTSTLPPTARKRPRPARLRGWPA